MTITQSTRRSILAGAAAIAPVVSLPGSPGPVAASPAYTPSPRTRTLMKLIEQQERDVDHELTLDEGTPEYALATTRSGNSWRQLKAYGEAVVDAPVRSFDDLVARALLAQHLHAGKGWRGIIPPSPDLFDTAFAATAMGVLVLAGLADRTFGMS